MAARTVIMSILCWPTLLAVAASLPISSPEEYQPVGHASLTPIRGVVALGLPGIGTTQLIKLA